ncbi:hypothetical protein [Paracoccus sp. N5]|uniref:hypothetical protein n=1 Tax=Paracoccus sp. N5 TaxID=1101189 RepID=UPI0003707998|nr:hypothetical protein [Paracoccus sp. N5]
MKVSLKVLIAGLSLAAAGSAYADCAADLAQMESGMPQQAADGMAKDGSTAPMQKPDQAQAGESNGQDGNQIAKDGSTAPLQDAGSNVADRAMSGQDAQAQQEGDTTAAEQAQAETGSDAHAAALKEARAALEKGDEAACQAALEKAKAS